MELNSRRSKKSAPKEVMQEVPSYVASPDSIRKVVFLGDANVGKTSLIQRFVNNSMPTNVSPTVGA